ncbi:hypothetical protein PPL_12011 [Heterostelium album PN500]|uniref:Monalysin Pore-forming domain-containing protein n=1 Tax=Heterostelium pallidum (strain ATCC 26659 / Pp 5 / PN500) TaxID=670386 RepID=D3BV39_HETP5|nr:hypothetical protein PPL_12011 [Heterostelium album PN500]EFA74977.1 hypothetical protein PPL_12011 [Heterostelium album PN500]|eukprot:XP_020427111.1 hypothetical protein PPL_12011 [Heterostelium album PN500]
MNKVQQQQTQSVGLKATENPVGVGNGGIRGGASLSQVRKSLGLAANDPQLERDNQFECFFKEIILGNLDLNNVLTAKSDYDIQKETKLKDIPNIFMLLDASSPDKSNLSGSWSGINSYPYHFFFTFNWATRGKPVAAYSCFHQLKSADLAGTYGLLHKQGSPDTKELYKDTVRNIGKLVKHYDDNSRIKTGFDHYTELYQEQAVEGWEETLAVGNYMVYQTKLVYAFEILMESGEDAKQLEMFMNNCHTTIKQSPKVYSRENRLFYFIEFYKNEPFCKPYSQNLYRTWSKNDVISYLMNEGWNKWNL